MCVYCVCRYVCRHVCTLEETGTCGFIEQGFAYILTQLILRYCQGKVKTVDEQMEHLSEMRREPQVGFDTFTSQLSAKHAENLFLSRLYYIYYFESEMDETPAQRPPQICPIAFIHFKHAANQNSVPRYHY